MVTNNNPEKPLYYQIQQNLKEKIAKGELKVGDKLPNEERLADSYGVSRMTVRSAITQLVNEGLVKRQQGRGSFITIPRLEAKPPRLNSFFLEMKSKGFDPTSIVLDLRVIDSSDIISNYLDLKHWEKVVKLQRLRIVNGVPIAFQANYIPEKFVPNIVKENFEKQSFKLLIEEKYGLEQGHAVERIKAQSCDEEAAKYLNLKNGDPVLFVERLSYFPDETPLLIAHTVFNSERYTYIATLFPTSEQNK